MFRRTRNEVTAVAAGNGSIAAGGNITGAVIQSSTYSSAGGVATKIVGRTAEITIPKDYTLIVNGKQIDY